MTARLTKKGEIEAGLLPLYPRLVGVDEVGRGCLAGPVFAAAVAVNYTKLASLEVSLQDKIRDSKTLSAKQRAPMVAIVKAIATQWGVGSASVAEIEQLGIVGATFLAMHRALKLLKRPWQYLLLDGKHKLPGISQPQQTVVKGDSLCFNIAAASILAKESRDDFMRAQAQLYPAYGFEQHVGYGTAKHLAAIREEGVCPLHRRNFAPISAYAPLPGPALPASLSAALIPPPR